MRRRRRDDRVRLRRGSGHADDRDLRLRHLDAVLDREARTRGRGHLQLPCLVGGDELCDLALQRREQVVALRDLGLDRGLRGGALRDDALLIFLRLLQHLGAVLDRDAELLDLPEHLGVLRRDALGAVHARDHVVEAARSEDHLERRGLVGAIERDEAERDRPLARFQVVLGDVELVTVLTKVALDLRELCRGGVVLRPGTLERVREVLELTHDLLRLCALRGDRGVGKRRDCRQKGDTDPRENVRRPSLPTNDNPRAGGGTDAPGGAGTSRVEEASRGFGRTSTAHLSETRAKRPYFCT